MLSTLFGAVSALLVIIGLSMLFVASVHVVHSRTLGRIKRRKIRHMTEALKAVGVRFRVNTDSNVTAICTGEDFQDTLFVYMTNVDKEIIKRWEKVVLKVVPTFTFAGDDGSLRPVHTGSRQDLVEIGKMLVEKVTSMSTEGLDPKELGELVSIIAVKDSRLFVPYAGKVSDPEADYKLYGQFTLDDAKEHLFQGVSI